MTFWRVFAVALFMSGLAIASIGAVAQGNVTGNNSQRQLVIATTDNGPISMDRLIYLGLKNINYHVDFTCPIVREGYIQANDGTIDGVISAYPELESHYPNLIKVPTILETIEVIVFAREERDLAINSWEELDGLKVGILEHRTFIPDRLPGGAAVTTKETNRAVLAGVANEEYDVAILSKRKHETFGEQEGVVRVGQVAELTEFLYLNAKHKEMIPLMVACLEDMFKSGSADFILHDQPLPGSNQKKTVVHIISSNTETAREDQFSVAMKKQLEQDLTLEWKTVILDIKRFTRDYYNMAYIANLLRMDCVSRNVAAVVVSGDAALEFLNHYYYLYFNNTPVLYYGVSQQGMEIVQENQKNFTGIVKTFATKETVEAALAIFPDTKRILVVNDYTVEGLQYRKEMQEDLQSLEGHVKFEYNENTDSATLLNRINNLPSDSLVLIGSYYVDANYQYYSTREMKRLLERHCDVPIISIYSTELAYNAIGGKCLDYQAHGMIIGDMLGMLLDGYKAEEIATTINSIDLSRWVFDKNQLEAFGISVTALPPGSEIINFTPSIWDTNPRFVQAMVGLILILCLLLIGGVIFYTTSRRHNKQRDELQKELSLEKSTLENIIVSAPEMIFVKDLNSNFLRINKGFADFFGCQEADIINKGDEYLNLPSDLIKEFKETDQAVIKDNAPQTLQAELPSVSGEQFYFEIRKNPMIYDGKVVGIIGTAYNISHRKDMEDALRATSEKCELEAATLKAVFDSIPDFVFCKDLNLKYTRCNKKMEEFFQITEADLIGKSDGEALWESAKKIQECFEADRYVLAFGEKKVYDETIPEKGEVIIQCETIKAPIIQNGETVGLLGISRDITKRKEMERDAQSASQAKSGFLSQMSHEIRTPLNAVINMIRIGKDSESLEKKDFCLNKADSASKQLLGIINDILDMSKIEADKLELAKKAIYFEKMLMSITDIAGVQAGEKNQNLTVKLNNNVPLYIEGDEIRLSQIITNLLANAIKFTQVNGDVILNIYNEEEVDGIVTLRFEVTDTGIGISEEQQKRLFVPFNQAETSTARKYGGTGLGLAISKRLVEMMGGKIWVESEQGKGSSFKFTVKVKRLPGQPLTRLSTDIITSNLRILAVDDSIETREYFVHVMKALKLSCDVAPNGSRALEMIKRAKDRPYNIIFVDWLMPGMDGIELTKRITEISADSTVIMISVTDWSNIEKDAIAAGVKHFIPKPLFPSTLINIINTCIGGELKEAASMDPRHRDNPLYDFSDHTILITEDIEINREIIEAILEETGIVIHHAENGRDAVNMFRETPDKFDLIFMDINMPEMDGYEATRQIRSLDLGRSKNIPIVAMTANVFQEDVDKCLESGMNDHIGKPIDSENLFRVLRHYLKSTVYRKHIKDVPKSKPQVTWNKDLLTGNLQVDSQHQSVFEGISRMADAYQDMHNGANLRNTLAYLEEYTINHFAHEETLQQEHNYPHYEEHKKEHDAFKEKVNNFIDRFNNNEPPEDLQTEVFTAINEWMADHVQERDTHMGEFLRQVTNN